MRLIPNLICWLYGYNRYILDFNDFFIGDSEYQDFNDQYNLKLVLISAVLFLRSKIYIFILEYGRYAVLRNIIQL